MTLAITLNLVAFVTGICFTLLLQTQFYSTERFEGLVVEFDSFQKLQNHFQIEKYQENYMIQNSTKSSQFENLQDFKQVNISNEFVYSKNISIKRDQWKLHRLFDIDEFLERNEISESFYKTTETCTCAKKKKFYDYATLFDPKKNRELQKMNYERNMDYKDFIRRNYFEQSSPKLILSQPSAPIEYITSGLTVQPDEQIQVPLKILQNQDAFVNLKLFSSFGSFEIPSQTLEVTKEFKKSIYTTEIRNLTVGKINKVLDNLVYAVRVYDARPLIDYVKVVLNDGQFEILFPIEIKRIPMPILNFKLNNTISDKVTIVTKTFLRYKCVAQLLASIQKFYPTLTVIIADDSLDEAYETINTTTFPNAKQYRMPQQSGWFAGRALAISQVETDYFVWVDDDFVFTKLTDLNHLLNVIETTGYDLIGGAVASLTESYWNKHNAIIIEKDSDGFCFDRIIGKTLPLPGFPDCHKVDVTQNFFIARTLTAGTVRMDPTFKQMAHREYFIDSLGKLRMARCDKPLVGHNPLACAGRTRKYMSYRLLLQSKARAKLDLENKMKWYYRNYFKCSLDLL